jgi:hypothetical protein
LVYANPYDFYRARPTSFSELGGTPANDATDKAAFTQWWNSGDGRAHFVNDFASKLADTQDAFLIGIGPYKLNPPAQVPDNTVANNSPSGVFQVNVIDNNLSYVGFINYLDAWARVLADNSGTLDRYIGDVTNDLTRLVSLRSAGSALSYTERLKHARDSLGLLKESANNFIQRSKTGTLTVSSTDIAQPVRRFHLADENDIIYNGIKLNGDICNTVTVGEKNYVASKFIPTHHRKVLDCNPLLVSKDNVATGALDNIRNGYAQTFLCEELGRMYVGDLVLRGKEGIEPHDVILINDPITGIKGPVKVKKVIHAFDAVSGFITIVTPECLILTNESATASILGLLDYAITNAKNNQKPILDNYLSILKNNPGTTTTVGVAAGIAIPAGIAGIAALGTIVSGTVLLPLAAAAGIFMAGYGLLTYLQDIRLLTPVIPMPLSRYGIVWAAGLEGYKSGNFTELFKDKYENFLNSEFYPLIESWRTLSGEVNLTINAVASSTATAGTQVATPRATSKKIGVMPDKTNTYLAKYAPIYGVPLNFARGIAWIESQGQQFNSDGSLNQTKIKKADGSPASSAIGVMQLVKGTAKQLGVDATKWEGNCEGGCKYLGQLVREFNGNLTLAAAAYYQGPGSVKKSGPNQAGAQYAANVLNAIS